MLNSQGKGELLDGAGGRVQGLVNDLEDIGARFSAQAIRVDLQLRDGQMTLDGPHEKVAQLQAHGVRKRVGQSDFALGTSEAWEGLGKPTSNPPPNLGDVGRTLGFAIPPWGRRRFSREDAGHGWTIFDLA
jgi:hypothetical protein